AVLRNVCRNKDSIIEKIENAEGHIKFSANSELFDMIKEQYPEDCDKIFTSFFGNSPMFLRVNTIKSDVEAVALKVNGEVIHDTAVLCKRSQDAMKSLDSGEFYIQGLASQKAVSLLSAQRGQTVIDVCACPGGKSIGAAIDMNNEGKIYSFDIHKKKLPLIENTAKKLDISIITTDVQDARNTRNELIGIADRVICDVPCSGTGVMGSKPEIKYKSPSEFEGLYPTQKAIINSASKYLKIGGIMVYSTCSINQKENEEVIKEFLMNNSGYSLLHEETCLPFGDEKEGFYMAKIIREY
ncbi:MAG: methyltransferase domain-containing protein, partial [Clostridia bacterium]|nr:methyltransferase domain-containing protein [Clostridia bacterium]